MVDQYNENQYDDDLTVGAGEYEYDHTDVVDLFEFSNREESPTSRLKSLILSIDWEITDEVLVEFNEELVYLQGIWGDEKINLIYVQALQKVSKYIYRHKASAHPNAIKLLLKFYYNLEKIVSSLDLSGKQKKEILLEDVKSFEVLKRQIAHQVQDRILYDTEDENQNLIDPQVDENELVNLKATILGIDWEITEDDLNILRQEAVHLEKQYADSRPRLILLQGIGTLGAYIKVHKSDANGDAFKLLRLFFESLEKMVVTPMTLEEEKAILFPVVEKFNSFKALINQTISSADVQEKEEEEDDEDVAIPEDGQDFQPALADFGEGESRGFQEEEEARELGAEGQIDVSSHIDDFFGAGPEDVAQEDVRERPHSADGEGIIPGVDVGFDDEDLDDDDSDDVQPALTGDVVEDEFKTSRPAPYVDKDLALQGVDVETEADDESDEEALPLEESGLFAPALGDSGQASAFSAQALSDPPTEGSVDEKLQETLDGFFVEEEPTAETTVDIADDEQITYEEDVVVEAVDELVDEVTDKAEGVAEAIEGVVAEGVEEAIEEDVDEVAVEGFEDAADEITEEVVAEEVVDDVGDVAEERVDDISTEADTSLDVLPGLEKGIEEPEVVSEINEVEIDDKDSEIVEEEVVFELVDEIPFDVSSDPVLAIGQYIDFVSRKFDEKIVHRLGSEIIQLQRDWESKTLELSFLQLLATVTQHLDRYQFESDEGAYELLQSNYAALGMLEERTLEQNQERLFGEISKVLKWQQDLLFQQTMPR